MSVTQKTSEEIRKELGGWLKNQRKFAGLTQEFLSDNVPMDRVHLARIESGESGTKRDTLLSIKKSKTNHKVDSKEALERYYGRWNQENQSEDTGEGKEYVGVKVALLGAKNFSEKNVEEFYRDMAISVEIAKRKLEEREKAKE